MVRRQGLSHVFVSEMAQAPKFFEPIFQNIAGGRAKTYSYPLLSQKVEGPRPLFP